jgi:hypothetical protein
MSDLQPQPRATPPGLPPDQLVLAAIERAWRHRAADGAAVPAWAVLEHLALPRRSRAARHVRDRLEAMRAAGWLQCSRRHGVPTWELTRAGRARLDRARRAGEVAQLPESPQHRAWRDARAAAAQELERFRARLRERLAEAARQLDADPPAHSDAWLELGEQLQRDCRRVASASYCLREWAEPRDDSADLDEHLDATDYELDPALRLRRRARRSGRRNIRLWNYGS